MNLKKCPRCNEFHVMENQICQTCYSKDKADLEIINNYINNNEINLNQIEDKEILGKLIFETGLSSSNILRITESYINLEENIEE